MLDADYIVIKVDVEEMTDGKHVADELLKKRPGGFPWFVILDASGVELASSNGPGGANIGAPMAPDGQKHFVSMIRSTIQHAPDETVEKIQRALASFAAAQ